MLFLFRCDGIQTRRQRCNGAVGYQIQNEPNAPPAIFAQQVHVRVPSIYLLVFGIVHKTFNELTIKYLHRF